ncbi:MAG: ribosome small subunit-dependent GTPase A [Candidatus Neomarinimicrobiota bacterium]|nr:MAG: ribosome small subunit-dependent GTPase A [Candidatus Neomarinimicrobiota bacterium]
MINFLGYNEKDFPIPELPTDDACIGRVIEEHRERYFVMCEQGVIEAGVTGKIMFTSASKDKFPAVGDWVILTPMDGEQGIIHQILPRKTVFHRQASGRKAGEQVIAANIDIAFVVMSGDEDFSLNRLERYLTIIYEGNITPVIILNKTDLFTKEEVDEFIKEIRSRHPDAKLIWTSALTETGLKYVVEHLSPSKTYCFVGSSGVGKSSLINRLIGGERQRVDIISDSTAKGKHTTTYRELIELENGSFLVDTPGMREVGISGSDIGLEETFADIISVAENCRFRDCTHTGEPGCAVIAACKSGKLNEAKLENYLRLKRESDFYQIQGYERRQKGKSFAKMVKEAKNYNKKKTKE